MKNVSALLRVLCGIGLLGVSGYVYLTTVQEARKNPSAGVTLYGKKLNVSPDMLQWMVMGAGIVGVMLLIFGAMTFIKESSSDTESDD